MGISSNSITAGSSVTFTSIASDLYGNLWDVTSSTVWTIDSGAGGSLSGNTYVSQLSGVWKVTGSFSDLSQSMYLTVNHASAVSLSVDPSNANVTAGSNEAYSAMAFDRFGNSWDVTSSTSWSITSSAGGVWSNHVYTAVIAGTWTITAVFSNFSATTSLIVVPGPATNLTIIPTTQTITAGSTQTFTATANDANGNSWDVSNQTSWIIDPSAAGSWSNNAYTSAKAGNWMVVGFYGTVYQQASLTVTHGPIASITITPASSTINTGATQTYSAAASDSYGNTWNITSLADWNISTGAGGVWTGNTYTSSNAGNWTVTGTSGGMAGTAQLTVNNLPLTADLLHNGHVNYLDLEYFVVAYQNYGEFGIVNPSCDFNHDGKINFQDLTLFIIAYIVATNPQ